MMFEEQSELRLYFSMNYYLQFLGKIVKKNKSIIPFLSFKNLRTRSVEGATFSCLVNKKKRVITIYISVVLKLG